MCLWAQAHVVQEGFEQVGAVGEESVSPQLDQLTHQGGFVDGPVVEFHAAAAGPLDQALIFEVDAAVGVRDGEDGGALAIEPGQVGFMGQDKVGDFGPPGSGGYATTTQFSGSVSRPPG
nr:hypothetical protein [Dictyobacter vulcani]